MWFIREKNKANVAHILNYVFDLDETDVLYVICHRKAKFRFNACLGRTKEELLGLEYVDEYKVIQKLDSYKVVLLTQIKDYKLWLID